MRPCAQSDTARAGTFGLKSAILENKVVYVDMNDCPAQLDILAHVDVLKSFGNIYICQVILFK